MPTIEIEVAPLHPSQAQTDAEAARFSVWSCGRRYGKSVLSRRRLLRHAAKGFPVAYFAPSYRMLQDYFDTTLREWRPLIASQNVQQKQIVLHGGGVLDFWSLDDPDTARGRKYRHVAIDEAAQISKLREAWQGAIRPTLADLEGSADFYSSPRGHNFFHECFIRGQDPEQETWASWQLPTSCNPFIAATEIEAARRDLPERVFAQEYLAQFLDDSGGVFRGVRGLATAVPQTSALPGHRYVIGADWGRENDFSVFCVIDTTLRACVCIERSNRVEYQIQIARLNSLCGRFSPDAVYPEENSIGAPIIEQLRRTLTNAAGALVRVVPFQTTNASKGAAIDALALSFELRELTLIPDPVLIAELEAYEMERTATGLYRYSAPSGMHDDCVMALALGWSGKAPKWELILL